MNDKVRALERLRDEWRARYERIFEPERVEIGDFTYGIPIVRSWGENAKLRIGKFCSIGGNVQILLGGNHHTDWITTYPFNVLLKDVYPGIDGECAATKGDVIIGNDVWIGNDVTILSGVKIGDGAVIAAGAVVTKSISPYYLAGGVPARQIRWRKAGVDAFQEGWFNWPLEKIAEAVPILLSSNAKELETFSRRWEEAHRE